MGNSVRCNCRCNSNDRGRRPEPEVGGCRCLYGRAVCYCNHGVACRLASPRLLAESAADICAPRRRNCCAHICATPRNIWSSKDLLEHLADRGGAIGGQRVMEEGGGGEAETLTTLEPSNESAHNLRHGSSFTIVTAGVCRCCPPLRERLGSRLGATSQVNYLCPHSSYPQND